MARDRWRHQEHGREEARRRWEDDERWRYGNEGYRESRDLGNRRYGQESYGEHGGFGGQDYGQGPEHGRDWYGDERRAGAGRPYRGFEPTGYPGTGGFGYIPSQYPQEGPFAGDYGRRRGERGESAFARGAAGHREDWPGRGHEEARPRGTGPERGWWDRARDEVYSWMGDEEAERRRREDEMRGHYGRGPKGYTRSDERIREDVSDRLTEDWEVDASDIEVTVSNGEVTLAGTVDSRRAKRRAEDCAESVSGVRNVQNNLRVQQPSERTSAFGTSATEGAAKTDQAASAGADE